MRRYNKQSAAYTGIPASSHLKRSYKRATKYATMDNAKKALDLAIKTKKLLNVEYKFIDKFANNAAVVNTPTLISLPLITQGVTDVQRVGNSIRLTRYTLNYILKISTAATNSMVRIMVVWDSQPNSADLPASLLLEQTASTTNIVSPYKIDSKRRIFVLYDKVHVLTPNGANKGVARHINIPMDRHIRYDGNSGTVGDLASGNLILVHMGDEGVNFPSLTHFSRIRFIDN